MRRAGSARKVSGTVAPDAAAVWTDPDEAPERRIRQIALPAALGLAFLVMHSGLRGFARTFVTMWVHEIGHAVTGWLCGFSAIPGPWQTPVSEERMPVVTVLIGGLLGYAAVLLFRARRFWATGGVAAVLLVQMWWTLVLRAYTARALITFGGDGGCLVLGSLLMATLYVSPGSAVARNGLRWGFLVIGAFAFMDAFATWWQVKHSAEGVVFGENVGVGDTDPTVLVFQFGWSETKLVARYLGLAWTCLAALFAIYVAGLRIRIPWVRISGAT
jgi:hypothetical protein